MQPRVIASQSFEVRVFHDLREPWGDARVRRTIVRVQKRLSFL
jgi:hypothetical protein